MYNPCFECLNRYGRKYTEKCMYDCEYARTVKDKDDRIKELERQLEESEILRMYLTKM